MKISEFARLRGEDPDTVSQYMRRHSMEYDKEHGLTEDQEKELEKKYPLPTLPDIVHVDPEKERLKDELHERDKELKEAYLQIIKLQDEKALLIEKAAKIELLEDLQQKKELEIQEKDQLIKDKDQELTRLKSRGLWSRLLNK